MFNQAKLRNLEKDSKQHSVNTCKQHSVNTCKQHSVNTCNI